MDNQGAMAGHSNLMLVEIIYGASSKYSQAEVIEAELELTSRNLHLDDLEVLKNKVNYIGGISMNVPVASESSSESESISDDEEFAEELDEKDEILIKLLMVYFVLCALGSLTSLFHGFYFYSLVSLVSLAIYVYGIYGLLNRLTQPIIFLIGIVAYSLVSQLTRLLSFSSGMLIYVLVMALFNGAILYFLTKSSMRSAYNLDSESIKKAMIVGAIAAVLIRFV